MFRGFTVSIDFGLNESLDINYLLFKNHQHFPRTVLSRGKPGLTIAFTEAMEADSAKKYLAITDKIDPELVSGEIRRAIREMK